MASLAQNLLELDSPAFKRATEAPFLELAGKGELEKEKLEVWLRQDRLYAQAYVKYAARVINGIDLGREVEGKGLDDRLLDLFLDALVNVRRELKFFEDVSQRYELDLSAKKESVGVKRYKELFVECSRVVGRTMMLEAMVLLWGTEKCYLTAWSHAGSFLSTSASSSSNAPHNLALTKEFIPNWSSPEFSDFVQRIEVLLEELWVNVPVEERDGAKRRVEELWGRILEVETEFWPEV
ncbi:transcription regulator PAB1642 [Halenospora varia]|nr:transcription regulator PAB1642 [Halenospora varia]